MGRLFNDVDGEWIDLGDNAAARFEIGTAWTYLSFIRVENTATDERNIVSKWEAGSNRQISLRVENSPDEGIVEFHFNGAVQLNVDTAISFNTWYLVALACDGTAPTTDSTFSIWVYDMSGTSVLSTSPNTVQPASLVDATDLTAPITIGVLRRSANSDLMDGDIAHCAYFIGEFSTADVLEYLHSPARKVAQAGSVAGCEFYLPLGLGSPEPDLAGANSPGTVSGSPAIGDNPPVAPWYGPSRAWQGIFTPAAPPAATHPGWMTSSKGWY